MRRACLIHSVSTVFGLQQDRSAFWGPVRLTAAIAMVPVECDGVYLFNRSPRNQIWTTVIHNPVVWIEFQNHPQSTAKMGVIQRPIKQARDVTIRCAVSRSRKALRKLSVDGVREAVLKRVEPVGGMETDYEYTTRLFGTIIASVLSCAVIGDP